MKAIVSPVPKILGATVLGAALLGAATVGAQAETEQPKYDIVDRPVETVEVRRYGQRTVAQVELPASDRRQAFRILARYIFGANQAKAKIAMTAPVEMERKSEKITMTAPVETQTKGGTYRMAFFLPAKYTAETAPTPVDSRVQIRTVPAETIATIRYSGISTESARQAHWGKLKAALANSKWRIAGNPVFFGYDPPWRLPHQRRNEVAVKVEVR